MSGQTTFQSIDDFIACVIGMGFKLEDAQQAVSMGKLNMEEAIEWILAGKPEPQTPTASTLRLRPGSDEQSTAVIGSNPFSNPQPIEVAPNAASAAPPGATDLTQIEDENLISRTHMNDEQRRIKDRFEEKQRTEAQRKAKQEKAAQKKAKAQVLKQIQDDRESQKLRRGAPSGSTESSPSPGSASPRAKEPRTETPVTPVGDKANKCLLQVRLPNGRAIRETFNANDTLLRVWDVIKSKIRVEANMVLMQPFPRQEFTETHMSQTLADLGLTPSGSLVLKKMDKQTTPSPKPGEALEAAGIVGPAAALEAGVSRMSTSTFGNYGEAEPMQAHNWGEGQHMMMEDDAAQDGEGEQVLDGQAQQGISPS